MAASLDDILTTQKNGVVAINGLNKILQSVADNLTIISGNSNWNGPTATSETVASSPVLVIAGSGKIYGISVPVHSGASTASIHDSATTGGIAATNLLYVTPSSPAGFYPLALTYSNGIVLVGGAAGLQFCVSYSPDATT
jgi:hypothetical protein